MMALSSVVASPWIRFSPYLLCQPSLRLAGPKSANSCGASNPLFPAQTGEGLGNCGVGNNPNFPDKPEGQPFQD